MPNSLVPDYFAKKNFGTCKNNKVANTGLYMGYVKYLKILLKDALKSSCKDDQVLVNSICHKYNFIKIDTKKIIFDNRTSLNHKSNAIFLQNPGKASFKRMYRGLFEYLQFFTTEYVILMTILYGLLFFFKRYYTAILLTIVNIILIYKMDKSCM